MNDQERLVAAFMLVCILSMAVLYAVAVYYGFRIMELEKRPALSGISVNTEPEPEEIVPRDPESEMIRRHRDANRMQHGLIRPISGSQVDSIPVQRITDTDVARIKRLLPVMERFVREYSVDKGGK